ncbi:MAG: OmpA family protein [Candidatus Hydrogenedens sp.]|nr:OmpA family protein [Candidatus Hydrogenedens sp.]
MYKHLICGGAAALMLSGCLHGRGVHNVPVTRDYANLEKICADEVAPIVDQAHRVGAHLFDPYNAVSAATYLEYAYEARDEGDKKGEKDYAALAKMFAEQAIAGGSGIEDGGELAMVEDNEAGWAEWNRIVARFRELDPCKAKVVAPYVYAHIETRLAQAEHELNECHNTCQAIREMRGVEADIDAIWAKDTDSDGVKDMHDGEPWIAEDADGYADEDGMPEPKPYPVLDDVNFQSGSAVLSADAKGYLRGIADMLNDGYKEATLYLSAHTDSDASDDYNEKLSAKREAAVMNYLLESGVSQTMVTGSHHGESTPKAENTGKGKAVNRRVELKLDSPDPVSPFCTM